MCFSAGKASGKHLAIPLSLRAAKLSEYTKKRSSFAILGMLQSPMVLIMIVMALMTFAMPYLTESLKEELEKKNE